jgi:hypothetical protein
MGDVITPDRSRPVVHKHVQVREYVRGLIDGAEPGSPAPSERELVHHFGVARMTVRQALDALVSEGLLERVPRTLLARMESAGPGVARALEIEEGDKVVHWQRLRLADGTPMCIEDAYLSDSIVLPRPSPARQPLHRAAAPRPAPHVGRGLGRRGPGPDRGGRAARHPRRHPRAAHRAASVRRQHRRRGVALDLPRRPVHALGAALAPQRPGDPQPVTPVQ